MSVHAGTSAQRIRIGLTGLAFAFLLVLLGSIISRSSHQDQNAMNAAASNEPNDSLSELGVAPSGGDASNNSTSVP